MPPSHFIQSINHKLHSEPLASIFHTCFWTPFFILICPLIGLLLLISSPLRIIYATLNDRRRINTYQADVELAVVVTGCDCGFGRDLAFELSKRGFVVFAGCRSLSDSGKQFEGANNINALQMDVTRHSEIAQAADTVSKWMSTDVNTSKKCLHAIINNAGKAEVSLFDWVEDNERLKSDMDVNFYGSIFVIQQFLPLLKRQSQLNKQDIGSMTFVKPRIINVVSMAGLVSGTIGASMYHASKHAMEGFVASLRNELYPFDIEVVNVNPSFHRTNIVSDLTARFRKSWEDMPLSRRGQYNEEMFSKIATTGNRTFSRFLWEPNTVVDTIVTATEIKNPSCQYIVGSDAKTMFLLTRWIPPSILSWAIQNDSDLPKVDASHR